MFIRGGFSLMEGVRLYPTEIVRQDYRTFHRRIADVPMDPDLVEKALAALAQVFRVNMPPPMVTQAGTEFAFQLDPRRVSFDELKVALALALEPIGAQAGSLAASIDGIVRQQTAILAASGTIKIVHLLLTLPAEGWTVTAKGQFRAERAREAEMRSIRTEAERKSVQKEQRMVDRERRWKDFGARLLRDQIARDATELIAKAEEEKVNAQERMRSAEKLAEEMEAASRASQAALVVAQAKVAELDAERVRAERELAALKREGTKKTDAAQAAEDALEAEAPPKPPKTLAKPPKPPKTLAKPKKPAVETEVERLRRELAEAEAREQARETKANEPKPPRCGVMGPEGQGPCVHREGHEERGFPIHRDKAGRRWSFTAVRKVRKVTPPAMPNPAMPAPPTKPVTPAPKPKAIVPKVKPKSIAPKVKPKAIAPKVTTSRGTRPKPAPKATAPKPRTTRVLKQDARGRWRLSSGLFASRAQILAHTRRRRR